MYTSGTTGRAEGRARHPPEPLHQHHEHAVPRGARPRDGRPAAPTVRRRSRPSLQVFPFFHIGGLTGLYVATATGTKLVTMYKWDVDDGGRAPRQGTHHQHVTRADGAPPAARVAASSSGIPPEALAGIGVRRSAGTARPDPPHRVAVRHAGRRPPTATGSPRRRPPSSSTPAQDYFAHPDSIGRAVRRRRRQDRRRRRQRGARTASSASCGCAGRTSSTATGTSPRRRRRRSPTAGSTAATSPTATTTASSTSSTGSRTSSSAAARTCTRPRSRPSCSSIRPSQDVAIVGLPHAVYGEEVVAVVNLRPATRADDQRAAAVRRRAAGPVQGARRRSSSAASRCRARPPGRCSNASSATS